MKLFIKVKRASLFNKIVKKALQLSALEWALDKKKFKHQPFFKTFAF
jgi:hypothetical protein